MDHSTWEFLLPCLNPEEISWASLSLLQKWQNGWATPKEMGMAWLSWLFWKVAFWATSLAYLPWWSTASHQMRVFALQLPAIQTSKNLHTVCPFPARVGPLWGNPLRHRFSSWVFSGQLWTANKKLVKFCQNCTKYCNQLRIKLFAGYIYIVTLG